MIKSLIAEEFLSAARAQGGVVIDVRTPAEFELGHVVGAVNMPLFTNEERAEVGTIYKQVGKDEAVERGLECVGPRMAQMVRTAKELSEGGRKPLFLYCWRGGMRSGSVAWLLQTAGLNVVLLKGGYKGYRRNFEQMLEWPWRYIMLGGATGCGKTELLHRLAQMGEQVLDLEGLANHKGSVFGAIGEKPQPTNEHFFNLIHEQFRKFSIDRPIWCEGESLSIGRIFMPQLLYETMRRDVEIVIGMSTEQRMDRIMVDYGDGSRSELIEAFSKIRKRFGYDRTTQAIEMVEQGDIRGAARMGLDYYDRCYHRNEASAVRAEFTADNNDMEQSARQICKLGLGLIQN